MRPAAEIGAGSQHKSRFSSRLGGYWLAIGRLWQNVVGLQALWVGVFVVVGLWVLLPPRTFFPSRVEAGDIATRAYVAPRVLFEEDPETTREKQQTARAQVLPVYDFEPAIASDLEDLLLQLFEVGRAGLAAAGESRVATNDGAESTVRSALSELLAASALKIDGTPLDAMLRYEFSVSLEDHLRSLLAQLLSRGVVSDKAGLLENRERGISVRDLENGSERVEVDLYRWVGYPEEAQEFLDSESRRWTDIAREDRGVLSRFLMSNVVPNLQLNRSETRARGDAAAESTPRVVRQLRAGQVIVRMGDEIDATAASFINGSRGDERFVRVLIPALGKLLLLGLAAFMLWIVLHRDGGVVGEVSRVLGGLLIILILALLSVRFAFLTAAALGSFFEAAPFNSSEVYTFAIPFASVALITFLLYGRSVALITSLVFSILAGQFVEGGSLGIVVTALGGSFAAIYSLDQVKKRSGVTRVGLVVGLVNMVLLLMTQALSGADLLDIETTVLSLVCAFLGGVLVAAVTSFAIPVLEWLLSLTTDITLVELSNTNLPLLRRLAFEAPGTFQHSLMVANLAKAGCAEIGANPILAYTAGLYHDVGKINRPDYFIENQRSGQNPHDKLTASLSALIVIGHVKEGLELAQEAHLPGVVQDAILQHHGTHLLTFFHSRAVEAEGRETVDEATYRYPGPKPQSKVMGVLMLADAVEAAGRTLTEASVLQIRTLVSRIFDAHIKDGQLDQTDLTMSDIHVVEAEFERILAALHHRRVDYPGFNFDARAKDVPLRAVAER